MPNGFQPYFGASGGPPLYTVPGQQQDAMERLFMEKALSGLGGLLDERKEAADFDAMAQDPLVQEMLLQMMQEMGLRSDMSFDPLARAQEVQQGVEMLAPNMGLVSPPPVMGAPTLAPVPGFETPEAAAMSMAPMAPVARPAPAPKAAPKGERRGGREVSKLTGQGIKALFKILPHYAQLRMAQDAAKGRLATKELDVQAKREIEALKRMIETGGELRKRERDLLDYSSKMEELRLKDKWNAEDLGNFKDYLTDAIRDYQATANRMSQQDIAGMAASPEGSIARTNYEKWISDLAASRKRLNDAWHLIDLKLFGTGDVNVDFGPEQTGYEKKAPPPAEPKGKILVRDTKDGSAGYLTVEDFEAANAKEKGRFVRVVK